MSELTERLGPTGQLGHLDARVAYLVASMVGGAVLHVIMLYGVVPPLNSEIVQFTPRVPLFVGHLLVGATVGAFVSWRQVSGRLAADVPA